jgi:uncharacterized protein (DUF2147 family)
MSVKAYGAAALVAAATVQSAMAQPARGASAVGTWLSQSGETRVRILPCGTQMCGTIVWVKNPGKDVHNPIPSERNRDLVGIPMIKMSPSGDNQWNGTLYRYTDGQTFRGTMKLSGQKTMELSGCIMGGFICRAQTWTKVN